MSIKLGFTGTRDDMTYKQITRFITEIREIKPSEFHDGDCVGSDESAHFMVNYNATAAGDQRKRWCCRFIGHPPKDDKHRAHQRYDMSYEPAPYLDRNHRIVDVTDKMIATPKEMKEPETKRGGGTWATIRYARKVGRELLIIYPDGSVGE